MGHGCGWREGGENKKKIIFNEDGLRSQPNYLNITVTKTIYGIGLVWAFCTVNFVNELRRHCRIDKIVWKHKKKWGNKSNNQPKSDAMRMQHSPNIRAKTLHWIPWQRLSFYMVGLARSDVSNLHRDVVPKRQVGLSPWFSGAEIRDLHAWPENIHKGEV